MTHLLDTSAFLAYYFGEPGMDRVRTLLANPEFSVGLCVVSATEFWGSLKAENQESAFENEWAACRELFVLVDVDEPAALKAAELRNAASARLPTVDSLIAACAANSQSVLVHRDPHFEAIPANLLKQEVLEV